MFLKNTTEILNVKTNKQLKELDEEFNSLISRVDEILNQNNCIKTEEPGNF